MKSLVIVESPTKAKTISRFLGKDFNIQSSYGHLRDLPKKKMGIDIANNFTPQYVIARGNQKTVTALRKLAHDAPIIYFATDEDREGEAIAWHLLEIFRKPVKGKKEQIKPEEIDKKAKRIVFHEITEQAIKEALKNPRSIDMHMVNAQQARRILDRLVGYELSPFLWKKVARGLSAGRVQSVAVRLIVEREREIQAFKPQEFWSIDAVFEKEKQFGAKLVKIDGKSLEKFAIKSAEEAKSLLKELESSDYKVANVQKKEVRKSPLPPFITSTLQQDANRRLGYSARRTMIISQQLYEGVNLGKKGAEGLITYMRTDSFNQAEKFLSEAKDFIGQQFGQNYALAQPRRYKSKSRLAQEAHEAIRPTEVINTPENIKHNLTDEQYKIYSLIWNRAVATQMPEAVFESTQVDIKAKEKYTFRANGNVIKFDGYLKVYPDAIKETELPALKVDDDVKLIKITPNQHFTEPPARYSEAGLVKALEEKDIGRPSTYASIIGTIIDRRYVEREARRLKPTDIGFLVNDLLVKHFSVIMDYKFTAHMEDDLDDIAHAKKEWVPVVREFYEPFKNNLMKKEQELDKKDIINEVTDQTCEKCGKPMVIKTSRYGKFLACTGYPECKNTKNLNHQGEVEPAQETNEKCDKCGAPMVVKRGRYGPFLSCSKYPDCRNIKNIEQKTGAKCPQCNQGDIVAKRSRKGRTFYSCNRYPDCKFALWQRPTGEKCPDCGSLLVYTGQDKVGCSNKECKYKK